LKKFGSPEVNLVGARDLKPVPFRYWLNAFAATALLVIVDGSGTGGL